MHRHHNTTHRAFTLIEMLVVLGIVALVVAIIIPALSGAGAAAKGAATRATMTGLNQAVTQFKNDQRRLPGYFAQDVLAQPNEAPWFTNMNNMLIELAGGQVTVNTAPARHEGDSECSGETISITVDGDTVQINPGLIGTAVAQVGGGVYFTPDPTLFKVQGGIGQMGPNPVSANDGKICMPHLVDNFGSPILAWVEDDTAPTGSDFARTSFVGTQSAKFYAEGNRAFLSATSLGRIGADQTEAERGTILDFGNQAALEATMEALLGNPAYPDLSDPGDLKPSAARGSVLFHSAGRNGIYLGKRESGAGSGAGSRVEYAGEDDPIRKFDDIITSIGN